MTKRRNTLTKIHGYATDCTFEGDFELTTDRLRDQLNELDQIVLRSATLTRLSDGTQLGIPRVVLDREELLAVDAGPLRGSASDGAVRSRRTHTVRHRRRARVGPYSVVGSLHERPGVAPLGSMRVSRPFVIFTEAKIAYQVEGTTKVDEVASLIVNSRQISWLGDAIGPADDPAADHLHEVSLADAI